MTSKNSQAEPITITECRSLKASGIPVSAGIVAAALLAAFCLPETLSAQSSSPKQKKEPVNLGCIKPVSAALLSDLNEYLKVPTADKTSDLALRLCNAAPEGKKPCPVVISEDRVADFVGAAEKNPGIVPVLACSAAMAGGAIAEELNELQAKLLDRHQEKFLRAWLTIPRQVKSVIPKFEDFALLVPDAADAYEKKIKAYEARIRLLKNAPASISNEVAPALKAMEETVSEFRKESQSAAVSDNVMYFGGSRFFKIMSDKVIRMKTRDPRRTAVLANETLRSEGLNYKVRLKNSSKKWNVCSTAATSYDGCKTIEVDFNKGEDSCGAYALLGVHQQASGIWTLTASGSQFRVNAADLVTSDVVSLTKNENVTRSWHLPLGFTPVFLSPDLRTLYLKTDIKSTMGRSMLALYLRVAPYGAVEFVELEDTQKMIALTGEATQNIKGLDGTPLKIQFPKRCE
jgi:hypothetical protein